jgi:hypothetical protein
MAPVFPFSLSKEMWAEKEKREGVEYGRYSQRGDFLFLVDALPLFNALSLVMITTFTIVYLQRG